MTLREHVKNVIAARNALRDAGADFDAAYAAEGISEIDCDIIEELYCELDAFDFGQFEPEVGEEKTEEEEDDDDEDGEESAEDSE